MVKPHIVSKIKSNKNSKEEIVKTEKSKRIVSENSVKKMKDLMEKVVKDDWATGHKYYIDGFDIIGKTGTAQIYENGRYLKGTTDYISSISMMYPKNNPKIIIYAATKKPSHNQNYALADSIKELSKNIAKYYDMFNDKESKNEDSLNKMGNYISKEKEQAKNDLKNLNAKIIVIGNGDRIIDQYPAKDTILVNNNKVFLLTNGSDITIPSLIGWSRNDVVRLCKLLNINVKINGSGYVVSQNIKAGSKLQDSLEVTLQNKE